MNATDIANTIWKDCVTLMEDLITKINFTYQNYDQLTTRSVITTKTTSIPPFTMIVVASNDGADGVAGTAHIEVTIEYDTTSIRQPALRVTWTDNNTKMNMRWGHRPLLSDIAQLHLFLSSLEDEFGGAAFDLPISTVPK